MDFVFLESRFVGIVNDFFTDFSFEVLGEILGDQAAWNLARPEPGEANAPLHISSHRGKSLVHGLRIDIDPQFFSAGRQIFNRNVHVSKP